MKLFRYLGKYKVNSVKLFILYVIRLSMITFIFDRFGVKGDIPLGLFSKISQVFFTGL